MQLYLTRLIRLRAEQTATLGKEFEICLTSDHDGWIYVFKGVVVEEKDEKKE